MDEPARKRGRPRTLDRDTGLDVAARLFWEHGYEGTSIADLTKAMGVTPPSLYATFGSKEELFRQAVEHYTAKETCNRTNMLRDAPTAYEAISFYLYDLAMDYTDPAKPRGCMVSNAVLQHAEETEGAARTVAARREAGQQDIRTRLDRAVAEGELPADTNTEILARFYAAVMQGMSAQSRDGACTQTLRQIAEVALSAWPGQRLS